MLLIVSLQFWQYSFAHFATNESPTCPDSGFRRASRAHKWVINDTT